MNYDKCSTNNIGQQHSQQPLHYCAITGEPRCNCPSKLSTSYLGSALLVDMKAALRKMFTDHAVYTSWLVQTSSCTNIVQGPIKETDAVTTRLLKNPSDISTLLSPIIGKDKGSELSSLFTEHLTLAASTLSLAIQKKPLGTSLTKFYANGDKLGAFLGTFNTTKLSPKYAMSLMKQHNDHVIKLVTLRGEGKYQDYVTEYDEYYKHILTMSDAIYESLTM